MTVEIKKNIFQERFRELVGDTATQEEIAKKVNTSRQNVGNWLKGKSKPDIYALAEIAKGYNVSTDYLLGLKNIKIEEKEPALQEAKTSSSKNNSINNDNTKLQICQEETIDYKDKYYKSSSLLLDIDVNIKKAHALLENLWNDFAIYNID